MKYNCEIIIDKPLSQVITLFDDSENIFKWMEGLESFEHLSGEVGAIGSKSKLIFQLGKRRMEMTETILVNNLPDELTFKYDAPGSTNTVKNRFSSISANQTKYTTENIFEFEGFMMKIMSRLMSGLFKKQSMKYLTAFKHFAETHPKDINS